MTINATNITMRVGAGGVLEHIPASVTQTALLFPSNGVAGSDIRIVWDGANLLPRQTHTAIWKINHVQQTGYYAVAWHSENVGAWLSSWSFGTHPYPVNDGTYATSGNAANPAYSSGTTHYHEVANGTDLLSTSYYDLTVAEQAAQESLIVVKDVWLTQARRSWVSGTDVYHEYWPDLDNNPDFKIFFRRAISSMGTPTDPAFYFGGSDWTGNGNTNAETPSGYLRGIKLFGDTLTHADILTEAAAESNTPATSAGLSSVWYTNINPTVADITDKSGAGHNPYWVNTNRPSDFTL